MRYLKGTTRKIPGVLIGAGLLIGLVTIFGAAAVYSQTPPDDHGTEMRFNRILLLPVYDMRAVYGESFSLQGPLSGKVFSIDQIDPQAVDFVRKTISTALEQKGTFHLLSASAQDVEAMAGLAPVAGSRADRIKAIRNVAERKGADAAFCTYVYAFRNRVGTAYGIESPTMVSFEMNLVPPSSCR
jgi:hypothetical protein